MVAELAEAATTWTKEWVFVIQSRIPIGSSAYEQRLLKLVDGDKVRILPAALSQSALLEILSGADVGLAFYAVRERHPTLGRNLELAGKSSGKFSSYLHAGLPVICNQRGGLATYVEKWGCGKVVSSVDDIKMAMTPITQELEKFSDAARRCFSAEFATDRYLPNICNDIGKMVKT
jgi:hypothetical protein